MNIRVKSVKELVETLSDDENFKKEALEYIKLETTKSKIMDLIEDAYWCEDSLEFKKIKARIRVLLNE